MLLPVGVVVAFVAHRTLMRVRADVSAHVLHAHDAQRTVLGSANVIVHVISAANAAAGAGGFSRVVLSGAHAGMIPRRCPPVNVHARTFFNNTAGPPRGPAGWLGIAGHGLPIGLTSRPILRWPASRCPRPSPRGSSG